MPQSNSTGEQTIQTLLVEKELVINASQEIVWESILAELGPEMSGDSGANLRLRLETWPGGRWYRDLGENAGHLWGHVQVIKPPTLLEICGPMFMSYPAVNHVQYRLAAQGEKTKMSFAHRAFGQLDPEHRKNVGEGWGQMIEGIRKAAEQRARR